MLFRRKSLWKVWPRKALEMTHPSQCVTAPNYSLAQTCLSKARIDAWNIWDSQGFHSSRVCEVASSYPSSAVSVYEAHGLWYLQSCLRRSRDSSTRKSDRAEARHTSAEVPPSLSLFLFPWAARFSSKSWPQIIASAVKPVRYLPHLVGWCLSDWHCWRSNRTQRVADGYGLR